MGETVSGRCLSNTSTSRAMDTLDSDASPVRDATAKSDGPSTARVIDGPLSQLPVLTRPSTAGAQPKNPPLSSRTSLRTATSTRTGNPVAEPAEPAAPSPKGVQPTARALQAQQSRYARIKAFCDATLQSDFLPDAPHSVAQLDQTKDSQGEHFGRYREALRVLESVLASLRATTPHSKDDAEAVKGACGLLLKQAKNYLDQTSNALGLASLSQLGRRQLGIVREGIAAAHRQSLAMDVLSIDNPLLKTRGWNSVTAARVAELRVAIGFVTTGQKAKDFRPEAAPVYWIDSKAAGSGRLRHEFIFKPMDGDLTGRGPVKEVLASGMAGRFEARSGIHLGVPDTQMVKIEARALELRRGEADGRPRTGSLQEYVMSRGTLKDQGDDAFQRIPARACQRMAIFDVAFANLQRHPDNLLLPVMPQDAEFILALIDNAEAFAGINGFQTDAIRNCGLVYDKVEHQISVRNALLRMPAAYLPFDDDMLKGLAAIDPAAMMQDMQEELQGMDARHLGLDARGRVDRERMLISKRCLQFLQRAAGELSPAAVRIAIGRWGFALMQAHTTEEFDAIVKAAIADIQPKTEAYKALLAAHPSWQNKAFSILFQLGQWRPGQGLDTWIMEDPKRAVALLPQRDLE